MGAAIVLLAAGLDLPNTVKGILADCGYTSPERDCTEGVRRPRTTGEDHVSVGKAGGEAVWTF